MIIGLKLIAGNLESGNIGGYEQHVEITFFYPWLF